jgi:hypothetical protein
MRNIAITFTAALFALSLAGCGGKASAPACTAQSNAAFCSDQGITCGSVTATDNCGVSRTVASCGGCNLPLTCGGGGNPGHCGCTSQSNADFCSSQGTACGSATGTDNCGVSRTVANCGACTGVLTCGGGGSPGVCGCTPETDAQLCVSASRACGGIGVTDRCGTARTVASCGTCGSPLICGGAGTAGQCGLPPITGKVVDENGTPLPTAKVAVLGLAAVATTDAIGGFKLPGVGYAYDIAAALGASASAVVYRGVTRTDPTLVLPLPQAAGYRQATLTLTAAPAPAAGGSWSIGWAPPLAAQTTALAQSSGSPLTGTTLNPTWNAAWTSLAGTLWAFERDASGNYVRTGSFPNATALAGQTVALAVPMTAATSGTVSGTSAAAAGAGFNTFWSTTLQAETDHFLTYLSGKSFMPGVPPTLADGPFSFAAPVGTGFGLRVTASASGATMAVQSCTHVTANASNVNVTVPAGPSALSPAVSATLPAATATFQWTQGGASLFRFQLDSTASRLNIFANATSVALPDLSALGWTLPLGTYQWQVTSSIPALGTVGPTVDDAANGPLQWTCNWSQGFVPFRAVTLN